MWQSPDDRQRVLGVCHAGHLDRLKWKRHAPVAVPCAEPPAFGTAQARQLPGGFGGLLCLDPDGGETGLDEFAEVGGEGEGSVGGGCLGCGLGVGPMCVRWIVLLC